MKNLCLPADRPPHRDDSTNFEPDVIVVGERRMSRILGLVR